MKALLSFQDALTDQTLVFKGGQKLNAYVYAARLVAGWRSQQTCDTRPDNKRGDNCPATAHKLNIKSIVPGGCDTMATYDVTTTTGGVYSQPAQLHNKLLWAQNGGFTPDKLNPYISFTNNGNTVSIDPVGGLNPPTPTPPVAGSCWDACTLYSEISVATQCCSCNGATGALKVAMRDPNTYNCK